MDRSCTRQLLRVKPVLASRHNWGLNRIPPYPVWSRQLTLAIAVAVVVSGGVTRADEPDVRRTPTVVAVEKAHPCVAAIYVQRDGRLYSGSGTVIDPRGYVLTCNHILGGPSLALLPDRPALRSKVVARLPERDLAVLKLGRPQWPDEDRARNDPLADQPLPYITLGLSEESLLGETVLNIGNPGGRGVIVTQGIISSTGQILANALGMARRTNDPADRFVQFDAPSNGGNSGGALIDLRAYQIGIVTGGIRDEEGANYAVPVDAFRENLAAMLHAGLRGRFTTGLTVGWKSMQAIVSDIEPGGPADTAGLRIGDRIIRVNSTEIESPIGWELTALDWTEGDALEVVFERDGVELASQTLTLAKQEPLPAADVDNLQQGLLCRAAKIPDTAPAVPIPTGATDEKPAVVIPVPVANPPGLPADDWYELEITGYLRVPADGIYRIEIESDDGSVLYLHDQLVIENGENHPARTRSTWQLLEAGDHPIRISYFDAASLAKLELRIGSGLDDCKPVSPEQLFYAAP